MEWSAEGIKEPLNKENTGDKLVSKLHFRKSTPLDPLCVKSRAKSSTHPLKPISCEDQEVRLCYSLTNPSTCWTAPFNETSGGTLRSNVSQNNIPISSISTRKGSLHLPLEWDPCDTTTARYTLQCNESQPKPLESERITPVESARSEQKVHDFPGHIPETPLLYSEEGYTHDSNADTLRNQSCSTLTSLTQNVLEHAWDLQAFARNAASSFFHSPSVMLQSKGVCSEMNAQGGVSLESGTKKVLGVNEPISYPQEYHTQMPFFGQLQMGWCAAPLELNSWWKLMKCRNCWDVYAIRKSTEDDYEYHSVLPDRLVNKYDTVPHHRCTVQSLLGNHVVVTARCAVESFFLLPYERIHHLFETVVCIWKSILPVMGTLLITNYRLLFFPTLEHNDYIVHLGIQWMHLVNYWDIPLGMLDKLLKLTLTFKEVSTFVNPPLCWTTEKLNPRSMSLMSSEKKNATSCLDGLCIGISTKDGRQLRFWIGDSGCKKRLWTTLLKVAFPSSIFTLYTMSFQRIVKEAKHLHGATECEPYAVSACSCSPRFVYNPYHEWMRFLGSHHSEWLRISSVNETFTVCATYPQYVIVPKLVTDSMLFKIALFRCKQRFPYLSWASSTTNATLWRCSQPKSMFQRCTEDEILFKTIFSSSTSFKANNPKPLLILDARPLINAVVNKASGAGFENTSSNYKGCRIEFASIDNIHCLRDAWKKMCIACDMCTISSMTLPALNHNETLRNGNVRTCELSPTQQCPSCCSEVRWNNSPCVLCCEPSRPLWVYSSAPSNAICSEDGVQNAHGSFLQSVSQSGWYDYVLRILRASNLVISQLRKGEPVVIHCSDGWDRTVQLTSLVMICMDPYYRTSEGFFILVEQEFLHGGHQFHTRCGHPGKISSVHDKPPGNEEEGGLMENGGITDALKEQLQLNEVKSSSTNWKQENAPVFIQWLDCVYQVMTQYKSAFEFSTVLLDLLAAELYNCFYGTFLCDCEKERSAADVRSHTKCLWNALLRVKRQFCHKDSFNTSSRDTPLIVNPHEVNFWYSYWFR